MKRLLMLGAVVGLLCGGTARAAWNTEEVPVNKVGTPTAVSVSTSAWTAIPTASSLSDRSFVCVSNASGNTASMYFVLSVAAPTVATTTWAYELETGENSCFPAGVNVNVYGVSGHTAAENARTQEWGQ